MAALIPKTNATVGSATPPTAGALVTGELAENKYTGRLYLEREDGTVVDPAYVQLKGDLSGFTTAPTSNLDQGSVYASLVSFQGVPLATTAPAALQSPTYCTDGIIRWQTPSAGSIAGLPVSSVPATTEQILVFSLNTDGVQRWTPTTVPLVKAVASFKGNFADVTTVSVSYSRSSATVTCTSASHGFKVGHRLYFNATSGSVTDKIITIATVPDADTFTFTDTASGTTSGNFNYYLCATSGVVGINSIAYLGQSANSAQYAVNMNEGVTWSYRNPSPSTLNSVGSSNGAMLVYVDDPITEPPTQISWCFRTFNAVTSAYADCGEFSSVMVL